MKKYLKWIAAFFSAVVLGVTVAGAAARRESAAAKEAKAEDLMKMGTNLNLDKAKKLTDAAATDKQKAQDAKAKIKSRLDKLGENSEDLDAIADEFNSRRLRKHAANTDT